MSELKPLPCPFCGELPLVNPANGHILCCKIVADDIYAWNALPRRADIERVERERDWLARQLAAQSGHSVVYWRKLAHRAVEGE